LLIKRFLQQAEFFGAADGSPTIVHPQLSVNVLSMGTYGAQRNHALTGNFRAAQFGSEQPEHFTTFTQRLDQAEG
jgi:hypothetical protein